MNEDLIRFANPISFSLFSYWAYWLLFDGDFSLTIPLIVGSIGIVISLSSAFFSDERIAETEGIAISGIIASAVTFLLWVLVFGRHPYIRELPTIFLLCLSFSVASRGFREKDVTNLSKALVLCEVSLGICFGWWGGREFEGKSRGVLTLVLLLAGFARIFLARLAKRFGGPSVSGMERWAFFLFAVAIGLIAFKYDIERRAPWSQAVFDLHLASQKLLPIIVSWLISTSIVLAYLSNSPEKNSRNE